MRHACVGSDPPARASNGARSPETFPIRSSSRAGPQITPTTWLRPSARLSASRAVVPQCPRRSRPRTPASDTGMSLREARRGCHHSPSPVPSIRLPKAERGRVVSATAKSPEQPPARDCDLRRNGPCVFAVSRGCFIHAPIATPGAVTGVDDRINTHLPASRRQPRSPAIGWTSLVLWIAQKRSRRP